MKIVTTFLGLVFGVFFTYTIMSMGMPPVLSSALAGLIGSLFFYKKSNSFREVGYAIYCGSFIGMGSVLSSLELLVASGIAMCILLLLSNVFKGYGGKLGFIAYISSVLTSIGINILGDKDVIYDVSNYSMIDDFNSILFILLGAVLGFYSTIYLHHKLKTSSVLASALPSFVVGLLAFTSLDINMFVTTFFSTSFVGMLSIDLIPRKAYPLLIVLLVMITIIVKPILGDFGGALGTLAFLSVGFMVLLKKNYFLTFDVLF